MTTYRRFIETNDHEGETWNFWLQVDGNMTALAILGDQLDKLKALMDWPFDLTSEQLDEPEVDLLIRFGESGYMNQHNKINGSLRLPAILACGNFTGVTYGDLTDEVTDLLYKGGIEKLFTGGAE
ncbi:hypothetical protein [Nocardia sp. NBC_01327]|uniref:hypothetical protein n=1 Tax=Nocardia sp. NBC_01327 TaxID=2903593 RepID=UPI002E0EDC1F|nr:hypothetical protein OG326_24205 [Nocardia sp. NBC_01327]